MSPTMRAKPTNPDDIAFLDDLKAAVTKHQHLDPMRMLAMTAQLTGFLLAMQDQTKVTVPMAMDLIMRNIEGGNQSAIEQAFAGPGGNA